MGDSKLLTLGLVAVGGYALYELFLAPSSAAAQSSGTPLPAPAGPATIPPPPTGSVPPARPAFNSLDQTYQRLVTTLQANASDPALTQSQGQWTATPDVFNYYLNQASNYSLDAAGLQAAFAGSQPISFAKFWSGASGWLAQNKGLTGIQGLGLAGILARGCR